GLVAGDRVTVTQGDGEAVLPVAIDNALPDGAVRIARGTPESALLGAGGITLAKHAGEQAA
ncbi:MAG TPA: hypothetical protein PLD37_05190, partial [Usitatibacteraceae bacterium]|nr:hypothetical protein [Usitatibacteraceae bacterium]